jgi:hypothetical protein
MTTTDFDNFPKFWYDSNACFGNVMSLNDLKEKLQLQLDERNSIHTIDDFLDQSKKSHHEGLSFGTRLEHTENYSLRDLLKDNGVLDDFLALAENGA